MWKHKSLAKSATCNTYTGLSKNHFKLVCLFQPIVQIQMSQRKEKQMVMCQIELAQLCFYFSFRDGFIVPPTTFHPPPLLCQCYNTDSQLKCSVLRNVIIQQFFMVVAITYHILLLNASGPSIYWLILFKIVIQFLKIIERLD